MTITLRAGQFAAAFKKTEQKRMGRYDEAIKKAAFAGASVVRDLEPFDLGGLKSNTASHETGGRLATFLRAVGLSGKVADITEDRPYAAAVEYGTRPFTPPLKPLAAWCARKMGYNTDEFTGGGIPPEAWAAGRAVQEKIKREGLSARHPMGDAQPALLALLDTMFVEAVTEMAANR